MDNSLSPPETGVSRPPTVVSYTKWVVYCGGEVTPLLSVYVFYKFWCVSLFINLQGFHLFLWCPGATISSGVPLHRRETSCQVQIFGTVHPRLETANVPSTPVCVRHVRCRTCFDYRHSSNWWTSCMYLEKFDKDLK